MIASIVALKARLLNSSAAKKMGQIGQQYCCHLKDIELEHSYDCIYMCWGMLYLNDADVISFLEKAKPKLVKKDLSGKSGVIITKENVQDEGLQSMVIEDIGQMLRTVEHYRSLFDMGGYEILEESVRQKYGQSQHHCVMFSVRPKDCLN